MQLPGVVMYADLFSADLFEYQNIFESEIATSVFICATATLLLVSASVALLTGSLSSTQNHSTRTGHSKRTIAGRSQDGPCLTDAAR
jgi:hypothetical protein